MFISLSRRGRMTGGVQRVWHGTRANIFWRDSPGLSGIKWDKRDSEARTAAMKRPARRAPGRRSGRAQSCRAQSGFALHDAILARTAGTLHRTMVRAQRVGNTPSSSFFLLPGEQREGGPAHMRETVERGRSWHPPSAGRERGEQAVVVGKGQRVSIRERHRRLGEDDACIARLDPVPGARTHEDVVDAPRRA